MIIDECVFGLVMKRSNSGWNVVHESLLGKRAALDENHPLDIGGSYFKKSILESTGMAQLIAILEKSGRVRRSRDEEVDAAEILWKGRTDLQCDTDHWALAIAQISGTRLLISNDEGLKKDFKKKLTPSGRTICRGSVKHSRRIAQLLKSAR